MADSDAAVLVVGEAGIDGLRPVSLEVLAAGRRLADDLGGSLVALIIGAGIAEAARTLGAAGADRLLVADDAQLAGLTTESATAVVTQVIDDLHPAVVLIPGTTLGRDLAPRVAARLGVGLAADCVALSIEDGDLVAVRPILGGRVLTAVKLSGNQPRMATVRPASFEPAVTSGESPEAEAVAVDLSPNDLRVTVVETVPKETGPANLDSAWAVVAGGRGLKEPENFALVEELAEVLGGAVGATRAVVDAGWRPHHEQVGQTGRSVSPRLYLAIGVSGAIQHNVGMQGAETVVAINRDPDAPIFKVAQFGIVGDLFEIVPALTAELRTAMGK